MNKILIIDDEKEFVMMLTMRLKAMGYEILEAQDGEVGLKVAEEKSPDLILLDIMMPVMDGYETLKQLKQNSKTKSIPVLMLTAVGKPDAVSKSLELGALDYIAKPFEPKTLLEKIRKALK